MADDMTDDMPADLVTGLPTADTGPREEGRSAPLGRGRPCHPLHTRRTPVGQHLGRRSTDPAGLRPPRHGHAHRLRPGRRRQRSREVDTRSLRRERPSPSAAPTPPARRAGPCRRACRRKTHGSAAGPAKEVRRPPDGHLVHSNPRPTDHESFEDLGGPCRSTLIFAVLPGQMRFGASALPGPCQSFPILVSNLCPERALERQAQPASEGLGGPVKPKPCRSCRNRLEPGTDSGQRPHFHLRMLVRIC